MNLKRMLLTAGMLVGIGTIAQAQIVPGAVALPDSIVGTRTLSADSTYQMVNTVKVGPGSLLSIPAGTIIYGNATGTRSCLQIERGGKIYAAGTATKPIIFTSAKPQGQKAPGDWGGIILLGNATINPTGGTATIEGGTNGIYGGNDDTDSSGVMQYVRIEYGGLAFSTDNEINGLTFGGIGNRTVIDHIQSSYTNDDSFEFFGGTVNTKYMIAYAGVDDDFDTDFGYRGRGQFFLGFRDSLYSDLSASSTSEGFEADNDGSGSGNTPISHPIVSNFTMVGPYRDTSVASWGQDFSRGGRLRRNTDYSIFNTVITGWQTALGLDQAAPGVNPATPQNTDMVCENTVVTGKRTVSETQIVGAGALTQTNVDSWFNAPGNNTRAGNHADAGLLAVTQTNLHNPDPRPNTTTSPARNGAAFTHAQLTGTQNNFTFTSVGYKGAFDPATSRDAQWDKPWSNYKPQTTTYTKLRSGWNLVGLANTPSNANKDSVFSNTTSNAFKYNAGYSIENTLVAGRGYWVQLSDNRTVQQEGTTVALPQGVAVVAGWNLVSTGASVNATAASTTTSGTTIQSSFFGFTNGYFIATTLEPGRAYWVKCSSAGTLTFNP